MKLLRAIFVFVAGAVFASAADQPATPKEISLEAAKRELDAIKAARNPAGGPPTGVLPDIATPELHLPDPTTPSALTKRERLTREQLEAQRKSKNWLLEGMAEEKKLDEASRDGRPRRAELESERALSARDELRRDELLDPADPAAIALREAAAAEQQEQERRDERESAPSTAVNPLATYMAGWMTPQDLALLQPGVTADGSSVARGGESAGAAVAPLLPMPGGAPTPSVDLSTSLFGQKETTNVSTAPENPYLQSMLPPLHLDAVLAPPPSSLPSSAPSAPPAMTPAPVSRQEIEPMKPKIPEFAKPSDDEKYFKQLKRF